MKFPMTRRSLMAGGFAALLGHISFTHLAIAAEAETRHVERLMRELIALGGTSPKNKLIKRISSVLRRRANTQSISLFALGTYRRQLPKNLVNDYVGATINYAAATFAEYVKEFEGAKFKVKTAQKSGKETIISGDVTYAGGKTREVRFKIAGGPSRPRVMDVNVQGLWLSLQLRKMFTDELKRNRGNFEVFIDWLKWITK